METCLYECLLKAIKKEILTEESFHFFQKEATNLLAQVQEQSSTDEIEQQIKASEQELANIMKAIKMGIITDATKNELEAVEKRIKELKESLSNTEQLCLNTILPKARERFMTAINDLEQTRHSHAHLARDLIRLFVGGKILLHRKGNLLEAELKNEVRGVLSQATGIEPIFLVAGARFELTTFRL